MGDNMEYLQVFDINRNKLDEKVSREEKLNLPNGKYFMVVLIFIENDKGEFLLQKTSKSRNSIIATTGGHVTYGDDSLGTVIKECKEELGLDILPSNLKFIDTEMYKNGLLDTYYTRMNVDIEKLVLQEEEVEYVKWFSKDEILDLIDKNEFREGNIEPFKRVIEYLDSKTNNN